MGFIKCIAWIAAIGLATGLIGTALPRRWFDPLRFPYRTYPWEQDGRVYEKVRIRSWKDRVPDLSKYCHFMVRKKMNTRPSAEALDRLARETCVAEATHWLLIPLSLAVIPLWEGVGGWIMFLLCALGNLPFILIQRYNRPRLLKMLRRITK